MGIALRRRIGHQLNAGGIHSDAAKSDRRRHIGVGGKQPRGLTRAAFEKSGLRGWRSDRSTFPHSCRASWRAICANDRQPAPARPFAAAAINASYRAGKQRQPPVCMPQPLLQCAVRQRAGRDNRRASRDAAPPRHTAPPPAGWRTPAPDRAFPRNPAAAATAAPDRRSACGSPRGDAFARRSSRSSRLPATFDHRLRHRAIADQHDLFIIDPYR